MNTKELDKIELKNDGHDSERFETLLKKVVNVPKDERVRREKAEKEKQTEKEKT